MFFVALVEATSVARSLCQARVHVLSIGDQDAEVRRGMLRWWDLWDIFDPFMDDGLIWFNDEMIME
jgi:hypothetical protein